MRRIILALLLLSSTLVQAQVNSQSLSIIPAPLKVQKLEGNYPLSSNIQLKTEGITPSKNLTDFAKGVFTVPQLNGPANASKTNLTIVLDNGLSLKDEGYRLSVGSSGIKISSKTERGAFYGLQTLIQLLPDSLSAGKITIPFVEIEDAPRYAYRGLHLDVGRHLFPVSFIKEYIDLIAQYKLNTFHWHLTEDQGWRIEIKKYPKLTSIGGFRDQTLLGPLRKMPQQFDGTPYGGFYTQDEVKEVVAYATSKYITVIPEIELPGHSLAALSAYPELACGDNPGPFKAAQKWGVFEDVYCAGKEGTFKFLENVLDEVLPLFPSEYIHIGGDECPKAKWKTCSYCQKRIKKEKLKDEHELQSYFIQRIEKYLNKKGRQIIGWDEILEGGLAPNATVMSWRGTKGGIAAAQQNHNVIMTPGSHVYLDHQESKSKEEPLTIGHYLPLEKVYSYNPTPAELTPEQQKFILGVQGNVWTEYMKTPAMVRYMILPRVYALAEIAWTDLQLKNWKNFSEERVPVHLARIDEKGLSYHVPTPIGAKDTLLTGGKFTLTYKAPVKDAKIYYTINGYFPYDTDYLYTGPIEISVPEGEERTLKSVVITKSGRRSVVVTTILKSDKTAVVNMP